MHYTFLKKIANKVCNESNEMQTIFATICSYVHIADNLSGSELKSGVWRCIHGCRVRNVRCIHGRRVPNYFLFNLDVLCLFTFNSVMQTRVM